MGSELGPGHGVTRDNVFPLAGVLFGLICRSGSASIDALPGCFRVAQAREVATKDSSLVLHLCDKSIMSGISHQRQARNLKKFSLSLSQHA